MGDGNISLLYDTYIQKDNSKDKIYTDIVEVGDKNKGNKDNLSVQLHWQCSLYDYDRV